MGQKVNPHGARVGVILDWSTKWYAGKKDFSNNLIEDYNLRKMLKEKLNTAGISRIDIQRSGAKLHVSVYTAKPGIVIGKGGAGVEALKKEVEQFTGRQVALDIMEIKNPDCDATLVAENIAQQLEKRISFRRAMKQAISRSMKAGAKGIKTSVSGRLGGAGCRPCAPTSTMASARPRRPTAASASRCGSTRARCCPRTARRFCRAIPISRARLPVAATAGAATGTTAVLAVSAGSAASAPSARKEATKQC